MCSGARVSGGVAGSLGNGALTQGSERPLRTGCVCLAWVPRRPPAAPRDGAQAASYPGGPDCSLTVLREPRRTLTAHSRHSPPFPADVPPQSVPTGRAHPIPMSQAPAHAGLTPPSVPDQAETSKTMDGRRGQRPTPGGTPTGALRERPRPTEPEVPRDRPSGSGSTAGSGWPQAPPRSATVWGRTPRFSGLTYGTSPEGRYARPCLSGSPLSPHTRFTSRSAPRVGHRFQRLGADLRTPPTAASYVFSNRDKETNTAGLQRGQAQRQVLVAAVQGSQGDKPSPRDRTLEALRAPEVCRGRTLGQRRPLPSSSAGPLSMPRQERSWERRP